MHCNQKCLPAGKRVIKNNMPNRRFRKVRFNDRKPAILLLLIWPFIFIQCNADDIYFARLLKHADLIILHCFRNGDSLSRNVTDNKGITIFRETILGKQENISSTDKYGEILFYSHATLLLRATRTAGGIEYNSNGKLYKQRITYRAGMYFDEGLC